MEKKKILVTGATGFIGGHLAEELARRGEQVRCLVRRDAYEKDGVPLLKRIGAEIVYGDLFDKASIISAMDGVGKVYHMAAIARTMPIPDEEYFRVNVTGTKNILDACADSGVKKIVYASSISAVGPTRDGKPVDENTPCVPVDTYGRSKLESERIAKEFFKKHKIPIVIIRYPVIFGPRDFATLKLFKGINTGLFPVLVGGEPRFEFSYVKNIVHGLLLAMEKGEGGHIYHLTDGKTYRLKEIYETIAKAQGKKLLYLPIPRVFFRCVSRLLYHIERSIKIQLPVSSITVACMTSDYWVVSIEKAKRELGFRQVVPLERSVEESIAWYKDNGYIR